MKILLFTNLFPNNKEPNRGIFVLQCARYLSKMCELMVVSHVPWWPKWLNFPASMAMNRSIVQEEKIDGITVFHPRWVTIPAISRLFNGFGLFLSLQRFFLKIQRQFDFDILFAQWLFPDGFAAALLSGIMRKPLVLQAHGCDVNLYTRYFWRRQMIRWALHRAQQVIVVSLPMKKRLIEIGIPDGKISIIPNAINMEKFFPLNTTEIRGQLKLSQKEKLVLFIGSFEPVKGVEYLLSAFKHLKADVSMPVRLIMIGKGSLHNIILDFIDKNAMSDAVTVVGEVPYETIPLWINACDILCLPSIREGLPNVVLEAQACGKPVVASRVGGIPDVVSSDEYGFLVQSGDSKGLADALQKALATTWSAENISHNPHLISWQENARLTYECLQKALPGN
jgi:glycosyltransferase involved in cell wall biosynthesis